MYLFGKEGNQRGTGGSGSKVFLSLTPARSSFLCVSLG